MQQGGIKSRVASSQSSIRDSSLIQALLNILHFMLGGSIIKSLRHSQSQTIALKKILILPAAILKNTDGWLMDDGFYCRFLGC